MGVETDDVDQRVHKTLTTAKADPSTRSDGTPVSHSFCFFSRPSLGGGEVVHSSILDAVQHAVTRVFYDTLPDHPATGADSSLPTARAPLDPENLAAVANEINRCPRPLVFGGVSSAFYELLPRLLPHVLRADILHGDGLDLAKAAAFAPYIDQRIIVTRALYRTLGKYYLELGLEAGLLSRLRHVENKVAIPANPVIKNPTAPLNVIFVARGCKEKRIHLVGRIARSVRQKLPESTFRLVGDHARWLDPGDSDYCEMLGFVDDRETLLGLYNQAHLIILTSSTEGFPLVIAEAMASGVVPVCVDVGGVHQHVIDGLTGVLVRSGEEDEIVADFVNAIVALDADRNTLTSFAANARHRAASRFSADHFDEAYRRLFTTGSVDTGDTDTAPPAVAFLLGGRNQSTRMLATVTSLLAQTSEEWQLVIVDDCSLEGDYRRLLPFTANPGIRIIRNARTIGDPACRAKAASWADAGHICFLEAGDVLPPTTVEFIAQRVQEQDALAVHLPPPSSGPDGTGLRPRCGLDDCDLAVVSRAAYQAAGGIDKERGGSACRHVIETISRSVTAAELVVPAVSSRPFQRGVERKKRLEPGIFLHQYLHGATGAGPRSTAASLRLLYRGLLTSMRAGDDLTGDRFASLLVRHRPFSPKILKIALGWRLYRTLRVSDSLRDAGDAASTSRDGLPFPASFPASDPRMQHNTGAFDGECVSCRTGRHNPGHCLFGPGYLVRSSEELVAGFLIELEAEPSDPGPVVTLDVYDNKSDRIISIKAFHRNEMAGGTNEYRLRFPASAGQKLETRVYWHGTCDLKVHSVVLTLHE